MPSECSGQEYYEKGNLVMHGSYISLNGREFIPFTRSLEYALKEVIGPSFNFKDEIMSLRRSISDLHVLRVNIYKIDSGLTRKLMYLCVNEDTLWKILRLLPKGTYLVECYVMLPHKIKAGSMYEKTYLTGYIILSNQNKTIKLALSPLSYPMLYRLGFPPLVICTIEDVPIMPSWFVNLKLCSIVLVPFSAVTLTYLISKVKLRKVRAISLMIVFIMLILYVFTLFKVNYRAMLKYVTYTPRSFMLRVLKEGNFTIPIGFEITTTANRSEEIKFTTLVNKTILNLFLRFLKAKGIDYVILFVEPPNEFVGPVKKSGYLYRVYISNLEEVRLVAKVKGTIIAFIGIECRYNHVLVHKT